MYRDKDCYYYTGSGLQRVIEQVGTGVITLLVSRMVMREITAGSLTIFSNSLYVSTTPSVSSSSSFSRFKKATSVVEMKNTIPQNRRKAEKSNINK